MNNIHYISVTNDDQYTKYNLFAFSMDASWSWLHARGICILNHMAKGKKSFILYSDQRSVIDMLSDDEAGKLLKHIFSYVNDENPTLSDKMLMLAFEPIKLQLKRDLKKWEVQHNQRKEAGKKSAEARKRNANEAQQNATSVNERSNSSTDNVNANVNVTDTVNANVTVNETLKDSVYTIDPLLKKCYLDCLKCFDNHLQPKTESQQKKWIDEIRKLHELDGLDYDVIYQIVKGTRSDDFWSKNFLSIMKLRKKNKDDVKYIVVFAENLKSKNGKTSKRNIEEFEASIDRHFDK